ncbi:MAG: hypothetical protein JWQ79_56 [Mucilaginibacter sp.]|nr:hypothetical protein [Mucilaginibacter sp.]
MQLSTKDIQIVKDYFSGQLVVKAYLFGSFSRMKPGITVILIFWLILIIQSI